MALTTNIRFDHATHELRGSITEAFDELKSKIQNWDSLVQAEKVEAMKLNLYCTYLLARHSVGYGD